MLSKGVKAVAMALMLAVPSTIGTPGLATNGFSANAWR